MTRNLRFALPITERNLAIEGIGLLSVELCTLSLGGGGDSWRRRGESGFVVWPKSRYKSWFPDFKWIVHHMQVRLHQRLASTLQDTITRRS